MTKKDIQDYLDKGMYGAPQIKPDEQRKYLGTFRERVVFAMVSIETESTDYDAFCLEQFKKYPTGTLSINANCSLKTQNHFMKLAQQAHINFKMVDSDEDKLSSDEIAMVFSLETAINLEDISVKKRNFSLSKKETTDTQPPKQRTGLLTRFFKS